MKEENPYVQIYSKDFEYEPLSETYDRFCEISDGWDNIRNIKLTKIWKKLKENGVDDEKREKIEDLLFQTDFIIYLYNIYLKPREEIEKLTRDIMFRGWKEYKQAIEDFLRRTNSIPELITNPAIKYLMIQVMKQRQTTEKIATYQQEFLDFLDKRKSEAGVEPHQMTIFSKLIYDLGSMLNPYFLKPIDKLGKTIPFKKECAEVIADILNGFFVNLEYTNLQN